MPSSKAKIIDPHTYTSKLGEAVMDWADMTTYQSVVMQSNLKFDQHKAQERQIFKHELWEQSSTF